MSVFFSNSSWCPRWVEVCSGGVQRREVQKHTFRSFFSFWEVSSWNRGRCSTRPSWGFTKWSPNAHFGWATASDHGHNSTRRPEERTKLAAEKFFSKNREILGGPAEGGPADGGPADGGPADGGPAEGGPAEGGPGEGRSRGRAVQGKKQLQRSKRAAKTAAKKQKQHSSKSNSKAAKAATKQQKQQKQHRRNKNSSRSTKSSSKRSKITAQLRKQQKQQQE